MRAQSAGLLPSRRCKNATAAGVGVGVAVLLLLCPACGYQVLRHGDSRTTVAVLTLQNDSAEPGLELLVTRSLRQMFILRGAPRLVADPRGADVVIRGRIEPLETYSNSFDTVALAVEYRVRMALSLEVEDARGPIPIERAALEEHEFYLASADVEAARKNRREALRRIADILAGRIHDALGQQLARRAPGGSDATDDEQPL